MILNVFEQASNRTSVELKLTPQSLEAEMSTSSNRTSVELKLVWTALPDGKLDYF